MIHFGRAAGEPADSTFGGGLDVFFWSRIFDAFIKCHGDSGGEIGLNSHGGLGGYVDFFAVYMRGEGDTIFGYIAEVGKRKHLEAPGIG